MALRPDLEGEPLGTGSPGVARPHRRGTHSARAIGAQRQLAEVEKRLAAQKREPVEINLKEDKLRAAALDLLQVHGIPPTKALVETAIDYYRAEQVFNLLAEQLQLCTSPDQASRLGQALAAQLKLRRVSLADLGLPGDPDERDDLMSGKRPLPTTPKTQTTAAVKKAGGLNEFMED